MKQFEPGNLLVKKWSQVCLGWLSLDDPTFIELRQFDVMLFLNDQQMAYWNGVRNMMLCHVLTRHGAMWVEKQSLRLWSDLEREADFGGSLIDTKV